MPNLVSFSFERATAKNIGTFANNVIQQMTADPQFSGLQADVTTLKSAYDPFITAYNEALKGGSDRIALRNTLQEALRTQLYKVALLVEIAAAGNPVVVLAAGYETRSTKRTTSPDVTTPTDLKGKVGDKNGSIALNWKCLNGSTSFDIQCRMPSETEWKIIKHTTQKSITIYGFELGKMVEFCVRANGNGDSSSDWSSPVSIWTTTAA